MEVIFLLLITCISVNSQRLCNNFVPGMDKLQLGVDLSTFDVWDPKYSASLGPVQNITCNQNLTWLNPISGKFYDVPDQLAEKPIEISKNVASFDSVMVQTSYQLEVEMSEYIHQSYLFGMASKTQSISNAYQYTSEEYRFLGVANSSIISFQMNFLPYNNPYKPDIVGLSSVAQEAVDSLPPRFNSSTVAAYEQFINYFGTHYATTGMAGGSFRCYYYTQKSFTSVMDTVSIEEQGGYKLSGFLQKSGAVSITVAPVAKAWIDATTIQCACYGGAACPDSQPSYETWAKDVYSAPWVYELSYSPISDLIPNSIKQASMGLATTNHFAHSYLEYEVLPALNLFNTMIKHSLTISGNPNCPIPANTVQMVNGHCGHWNGDHDCCSGSLNGRYCAIEGGAPFETDVNNVKKQESITNQTIYSLIAEANALYKQPIINVTQLTSFGQQFVKLVNIMESGIATKTCIWNAPGAKCGYDPHQGGNTCDGWIYCVCNVPPSDCGFPTQCPTVKTTNSMTYLQSLDHS